MGVGINGSGILMMGGINNVGKKLPTKSKFTDAPHHHLPISIRKNKVYTEKRKRKCSKGKP